MCAQGGHAAITIKLVFDHGLFPHPLFYWVAVVSMLAVNAMNLRLLLDLAIVQPTAQALAQDDYLNAESLAAAESKKRD